MKKLQGFYNTLNELEAIHFDLDGSLIESEKAWFESEIELLRGYGVEDSIPEIRDITHDDLVGRGQKFAARFYKEKFGLAAPVEEIRKKRIGLVKKYYRQVPLMEGADSVIRLFGESEIKVTLATSAPLELAEIFLERKDYRSYFDHVVSDDHVEKSKPSPEIFLAAAAGVGVEPKDSLVLEDSKNGVLAAENAGTSCLWVPHEKYAENWKDLAERADFIVDSLSGLDFDEVRSRLI
jgi:HAD superfamily hydrolase (TIGR01509 family)